MLALPHSLAANPALLTQQIKFSLEESVEATVPSLDAGMPFDYIVSRISRTIHRVTIIGLFDHCISSTPYS